MEQMIILQNMLDQAKGKNYDLGMECLISLINEITDDSFDENDLANACEHALCEWDV